MKSNETTKKITQTCTSRECKKKYKDQITKYSEAITTVQEFDDVKKTFRCLSCGKISKIGQ